MADDIIYSEILTKGPTLLPCSASVDWSLITATIDGEQANWLPGGCSQCLGGGFFGVGKQNVATCGAPGTDVDLPMAVTFSCVNGYYKATIMYEYQYSNGIFIVRRTWTGDVVMNGDGIPTGIANISGGTNQYDQSSCEAEFTYNPVGDCTSCQSFLDKLPASQNPSVTFS